MYMHLFKRINAVIMRSFVLKERKKTLIHVHTHMYMYLKIKEQLYCCSFHRQIQKIAALIAAKIIRVAKLQQFYLLKLQ